MAKNPAFNSFTKRTLSGIVVAVVVVGSLLLSPYTFLALLAVICIGGLWEFYTIAAKAGTQPQRWLGIAAGLATIAVLSLGLFFEVLWSVAIAAFMACMFVVFIFELYRKKENPLQNIAATLMGIIYIAFPLALLAHLTLDHYLVEGHKFFILGFILLIWANDVGAYLVGVAFGKKRLFERISPKKSWEGFYGGLIFAFLVGMLFGWLMQEFLEINTSLIFWGGLSMVVVISGVFGDLVESLLKRSAMLKDSGDVIPGHGGFLDRFDALLFSVPFVYLYFVIFGL